MSGHNPYTECTIKDNGNKSEILLQANKQKLKVTENMQLNIYFEKLQVTISDLSIKIF